MLQTNQIYLGDNLELLKQIDENSIHSIVSDFPYNLEFMGKKWDTISNFQQWCKERAVECLRVLKPGGYALIFGGSRTHHRLVCGFEDAGFIIKDAIVWLYGSGFPKSYDISKGFDKQAGSERDVIGKRMHPTLKNVPNVKSRAYHAATLNSDKDMESWDITVPSTDLAKQWQGWGTALKPAFEYIMVAQKPYENTYCYNVEKYGVGGLNIDDSRIGYDMSDTNPATNPLYRKQNGYKLMCGNDNEGNSFKIKPKPMQMNVNTQGRFPANVILDEDSAMALDEQSGITTNTRHMSYKRSGGNFIDGIPNQEDKSWFKQETGGASRFFYCAKSSKKDKTENGQVVNDHPTVKPTSLIKYLIRLVTPPNGISLDVCLGSGTHSKASIQLTKEGYPVEYIGFENDPHSFKIAQKRIEINQKVIGNEK